MTTQNLADVAFLVTWRTGDVVSKLTTMPLASADVAARRDASKNKRTLASMAEMRTLTRLRKENVILFLNGFQKGEADNMSDDDINERLQECLQEYINLPENNEEANKAMSENTTTGPATEPSDKKAAAAAAAEQKKAEAAAAAAQKKAEAEAAAARRKAEAETAAEQKKAEREAAAAKRKEEQEAKAAAAKAARDEAAKQRQAEIEQRKAEREQKTALAEAKLNETKATHDAAVAEAEAAVTSATEALKTARANRAAALKAIAEEYKVNVPGGSGTVTQVDKSSAFVLQEDYTGLDGVVIPKGEKMTVKKIHLAGIVAGLANQEILDEIKKMFPHGGTTLKDVAWHKNMVKNGRMVIDTGKRIS